jgi:hypothetical protein
VFENKVLKREEGTRGLGEKYTLRSFIICTVHQIL